MLNQLQIHRITKLLLYTNAIWNTDVIFLSKNQLFSRQLKSLLANALTDLAVKPVSVLMKLKKGFYACSSQSR